MLYVAGVLGLPVESIHKLRSRQYCLSTVFQEKKFIYKLVLPQFYKCYLCTYLGLYQTEKLLPS